MRSPAVTFGIAALSVALGAWGTSRSTVDPSPETYAIGTPIWDAYAAVDRRYEIGETVVIAFRELGGTVFDVETVGAVSAFDRALDAMPSVERVLSIASAAALDRENELLDLTPLLAAGPITKESAIELATRIRRHRVYGRALVDQAHETTFVFVQLSRSLEDPLLRIEATRDIRTLADSYRAKHRTVHLAGTTIQKEAVASALQRDTLIFYPLAAALLLLLLWLIFGELPYTLVPLTVIGVSSTSVIGLLVALGVRLNLTTAAVPILVLVVGLTESVHFLAELRRQHARTNDRDISLAATVEAIAAPSLVASAAAACGFLAMAPSLIAPLGQLAIAATAGLTFVHATTLLLAPAVLRAIGFPKKRLVPFESAARVGRVLARWSLLERRYIVVTVAVVGLLSGIAVAGTSAIRVDSSFPGYLDPEHRMRQDLGIIERTLGGAETLEVILEGPETSFFKRIEELERLDRLKAAFEGSPGIHTAFSVADYLRIANTVMTGDEEDRLPESTEAVAQLTVIDPTPFSAFTADEMQEARMALQVRSMTSEGTLELAERVAAEAEALVQGTGVKVWVTGLPMVYARLTRYVVEDAAKRLLIGCFFVWVVVMLGLRSVAFSVVVMVPVVLPVLFTLGTMAILGVEIDSSIIFVGSLGLLLSVSHAVQLATRYLRAREEGSPSPDAAVLYATTHGGHAIAIVSLLTVAGFLVLASSSFGPTFQSGLLGATFVLWALVIGLGLLPVLLMAADWLENRHEPAFDRDGAGAQSFRRVSSLLTSTRPGPSEERDDGGS